MWVTGLEHVVLVGNEGAPFGTGGSGGAARRARLHPQDGCGRASRGKQSAAGPRAAGGRAPE